MTHVEPVVIRNSAGQRLFGTLHRPSSPGGELPAVVLLSPGVKMRVGPGRLYVPLTDMLTACGFTVLRFDFFGLGDSEGDLPESLLADVYNNIEVGRYVGDTLAALSWLRETQGFRRFILGGLCGGAITALLAAERERQVEGLLSIGMTVTLASNAATPAKFLSRAELDVRRQGYYRRMLQPRSWWRFLTFQSEYGVLWRSFKRVFAKEQAAPKVDPNTATMEQRGNANPLFPKAFLAFLGRRGRALMLFSEKDRLLGEYEDKFAVPYRDAVAPYAPQIRQHVVANANHVLSMREWQQEMVDVSRQWLEARYASALSAGASQGGPSKEAASARATVAVRVG